MSRDPRSRCRQGVDMHDAGHPLLTRRKKSWPLTAVTSVVCPVIIVVARAPRGASKSFGPRPNRVPFPPRSPATPRRTHPRRCARVARIDPSSSRWGSQWERDSERRPVRRSDTFQNPDPGTRKKPDCVGDPRARRNDWTMLIERSAMRCSGRGTRGRPRFRA